ncbi:MAG: flagellar hook-associated protein FlgL [Acidobacteriota bacterium]
MRVTTMMPDVQYEMQQAQQALATATQQLSTGLRVNQPSDDPAAAAEMVQSLASSARVDQYTSNITAALSQMQTADSAIASMVSYMNRAITIGTASANQIESAGDQQAAANEVAGILSGVVALGNTNFQGRFVFGGSETSINPFAPASTSYTLAAGSGPVSASTALTAGSLTTISDASTGKTFTFKAAAGDTIATLQSAIASAASSGTLNSTLTATINASGQLEISTSSANAGVVVTSTDPTLTASAVTGTAVANSYAYVGNSTVNQVQVGDPTLIDANIPGDQLLGSGTGVLSSLSGLISALQSGSTSQITTATSAVSAALTKLDQTRVPLDNNMNRLNAQESFLNQEKLSLSSRQNSLVGISTAEAATNLSQAELTNNTVLAAAAKVLPQTLLDYLK